ncbi:Imm42 family immunity protein [Xanthomonas cannabis]|uniref:Imm42 family immunity protein n=1 Tax=Xanthomonas cannabis TaxID=1885674 RepID=UPI00141BA7B1|nr:Imm42 family immunity protein [Xanthomonas cannabis]NIK02859.1 hypothetical protein [Xanthomonas cannabis]NIK16696.1 hypothetical protein [Xanthomonas cannabis]NIK66263.1 hypothetical protein [Xanthomonas cannabis]
MIFGEKNIFAVEMQLDNNSGGQWMLGKFCYWLKGERVGNFEDGTSLRDVYLQMTQILRIKDRKFSGPDLSFVEIHRAINESIFGEECVISNAADYLAAPPVDVFDDFKVFVFSKNNDEYIITYQKEGREINFIRLPQIKFLETLHQSYEEMGSIYDKAINSGL